MMMNIWEKITKKQFSPLYLLYGTEQFLINETKQKLLKNVLSDAEIDFNFSSYDLEEVPVETALEDAETFPFLGEKRLLFLYHPFFLTAEKKTGKVEHHLKKLENYIMQPAPHAIVVFIADYEKLDERKKLTKLLKKHAVIGEAKQLKEQELIGWISDRASQYEVKISKQAAEHLAMLGGTNLMLLSSEIEKLALYAGKEQEIDDVMVDRLVAKTLEQNIFSLVDMVVQRKMEEALRIYYDLLKLNEEPIKILSILAGQFRLVYQSKALLKKGYGQQQIASFLKVHPFRVKLAMKQANLFQEADLEKIMPLLAECDLQMKTGKMEKSMVVEMFLFQLSHLKQQSFS